MPAQSTSPILPRHGTPTPAPPPGAPARSGLAARLLWVAAVLVAAALLLPVVRGVTGTLVHAVHPAPTPTEPSR